MIQNRRQVIDMKQHSRRPRKKGTSQKFTEKLLKIKMNLSKVGYYFKLLFKPIFR